MQPIVTSELMRFCDRAAIRGYGIPGIVLMEHAGTTVAHLVVDRFGPLAGKRVLVVCGTGNNGGDGFVVARHLLNEGALVDVVGFSPPKRLPGDAATNYRILAAGARRGIANLSLHRFSPRLLTRLKRPDLIVDALLGTGFSGPVKQPYAGVIEWMNRQKAPVVAVDVPSGVDASTGRVENAAVRATVTVTMGLVKIGLLCGRGREMAGDVAVADLGIPHQIYSSVSPDTFLVGAADVAIALPRRPLRAHKYSVGKVLVVAGSRGYTGAAVMTAMSALRSGAGAVMLAVPESVYPIIARKVSEPIVVPLPSTREGTIATAALPLLLEKLAWCDVAAVGPGLSQHPETKFVVRELLLRSKKRLVVDADGLNLLAAIGAGVLRKTKAPVILTPHTGELGRLTGRDASDVEAGRVESARSYARRWKCVLVLKGAPTVTAVPEGDVFINSTGNPGMATVGSGDVLTGLVAGLWAQGMESEEAAYSGVFLHGLAGDLARRRLGERSLVAGDLIAMLPAAFRRLERTN